VFPPHQLKILGSALSSLSGIWSKAPAIWRLSRPTFQGLQGAFEVSDKNALYKSTVIIIIKSVFLCSFWATVCKTVRPMLPNRCLSVCLSCLSVCDVGVLWPNGWIYQGDRALLSVQVGIGPGHIVYGDPAPLQKKGA